jgi:hypothetical protein
MWSLSLAGALVMGTVTLTDATGAVLAAPGVQVTLTCSTATDPRYAVSDDSGGFSFTDVSPDDCSMTTDLQGFASDSAQMVVRGGEAMMVALHLVAVPVRAGLFVAGVGAKPAVPKSALRKPSAKRCRRAQGTQGI